MNLLVLYIKKSSKIIGVIVPDIENPFFSELAKAVEDEAFQNGYRMLLCSSGNNAEKEMQNIQMLVQMKADGVIIMTDSADTGKVLKACQVPVVLVDRTLQNVNEKRLLNRIIIREDIWQQSIWCSADAKDCVSERTVRLFQWK